MKQKFLLLLILLGLSTPIFAENMSTNTDGVISSLRGRVVSPKVGDFSFFFDQEIRSIENFGAFKDSRSSLFAEYTPLKWLKVSAGYAFMIKEGNSSPGIKHRFILAAEGALKVSNFTFVLRERMESTSVNGYLFASEEEAERCNLARTRLKITSKTSTIATPYIYTELYNQTNESMLLTRVRSQAGVDLKLSDSSKLTTFYQYAHFTNTSTSTAPHTFGVMYTYKISRND